MLSLDLKLMFHLPLISNFLPYYPIASQSVENADVAFVSGANERNEFFEKIDKQ